MTSPKPNHDEIVHAILSQHLFNPISGYDVDHDDVTSYLDEFPAKLHLGTISNRVEHFKQWLKGFE